MLAIRCQFLQGTYQASPPGEPLKSEWPPHPGRLHAALVASGWAWGGDAFPDQAADALRWLERQPPPEIVVPSYVVAERNAPTTYVPRNLTSAEVSALRGHLRAGRDTAFQRDSGRVSRTFPTRVVGDTPVSFVWPDAEPSPPQVTTLERLAGELQYLGSSRSPVAGAAIVDRAADPREVGEIRRMLPESGAGRPEALRVAYEGLTDELLRRRWGPLPLGVTESYRPAQAKGGAVVDPVPGPFGSLLVARRVDGFGLTVSHAYTLADALRSACLSVAGDDAPALLHGHGAHPHAAFLALPNVGSKHSDGAVLGLALAVPANAAADELAATRRAFEGVETLNVEQGRLKWRLDEVDPVSPPRTLRPTRWIGPARRWSTVTPVILDRYPKPKRGFTLEDAILHSFQNALLPAPGAVEGQEHPALTGALPVPVYARPDRLRGLAVHVTVSFPTPVTGPLVVGRGRYLGLGLFAPLRDERDRSPANG